MKTTIEPLEDGNTRIRIPIEFRYDNGRKRIFFPEMPDEHLKINEPLATGIARAYRWQDRNTVWIFSDSSALVCTDWIEITKKNYSPFVVCFLNIRKNLL